jgi:hypothetical protein
MVGSVNRKGGGGGREEGERMTSMESTMLRNNPRVNNVR